MAKCFDGAIHPGQKSPDSNARPRIAREPESGLVWRSTRSAETRCISAPLHLQGMRAIRRKRQDRAAHGSDSTNGSAPPSSPRLAARKYRLTRLTLYDKVSSIIASALMKARWFKRLGWFYVPVSVPGGLVWLLAALFCLTVFRAADRHSHSVSDTLYGVFPFFVCTFLLVDWIAGRTAERVQ